MTRSLVTAVALPLISSSWLAAAETNSLSIQKLITFADADHVRIETRLKSSETLGHIELTGAIAHGKTGQTLWEGSLGQLDLRGTNAVVTKTVSNLAPEVWSPASPILYNLTVSAKQNSNIIAQEKIRFGFRSFRSQNGQFVLNGRQIFLRGLAINPPGRGIPSEVGESRAFAEAYVRFLKGQNVNTIRLTHDSQVWFDVCDELGMMIYQGQYGSPLGGRPGKLGPPDDFNQSLAAYQQLFETYARHPSILIYVLSNELPVSGTRGKAFHDFLNRIYSELKPWDPTRLFIGNAGYGEGREGDICDVHRYWGWYYNTFLTYYNLRDQSLFDHSSASVSSSDPKQPLTFTECVGSFTGPTGEFNIVARKQLGAQLNWTGHSPNQREDAPRYQSFLLQQATESFRRLRPLNPRLSGIMPFTILYYNWSGIAAFDQMKATPAMTQLARSYQPVLLSWELWTPQVYAPGGLLPIAHIVNDSEDGSALTNVTLAYQIISINGKIVLQEEVSVPEIPYYRVRSKRIQMILPGTMATGDYRLVGKVMANGRLVSQNEVELFISRNDRKRVVTLERKLVLFDDARNQTGEMVAVAGVRLSYVQKELAVPKSLEDVLIIGENAWDSRINSSVGKSLKEFIERGGRILCLRQDPAKFETDWLPEPITFFTTSANATNYPPASRPFSGNMNINPERPDHPVFAGLDRRRLALWSDSTGWNQTKAGFPQIYPVTAGFKLNNQDSLAHTAILADYDRGLEGIALCEMFAGKGSVILSAFDFVSHTGQDPAADQLLANLLRYAASKDGHYTHPLVEKPIQWGDYGSERGLVAGPLNGLVVNADWVAPPTNPTAAPITQAEGAWNTRPGDQFLPHGRSPFGPYGYSSSSGLRDLKPESTVGSGIFWARIPQGKTSVVTSVKNPTKEAAELTVMVNENSSSGKVTVPPGRTMPLTASIPAGATEIGVRFTGTKTLVLLETRVE